MLLVQLDYVWHILMSLDSLAFQLNIDIGMDISFPLTIHPSLENFHILSIMQQHVGVNCSTNQSLYGKIGADRHALHTVSIQSLPNLLRGLT